jgi:hypothetical protein
MGKLLRPQNDHITALEKQIRQIEHYHNIRCNHDINNNNNISISKAAYVSNDIKQLREKIAQLYAADAERDRFQHLPLYSTASTGYKFFCSPCWDAAYYEEKQRIRSR